MKRVLDLLEAFEGGMPMCSVLEQFNASFTATDHIPAPLVIPWMELDDRNRLIARIQHLQSAIDVYTCETRITMSELAAKIHQGRRALPAQLAYLKANHLSIN